MEGHNSLGLCLTLSPVGQWAGNLSWVLHVLLLLVSGLYCGFGFWRERIIAKREITLDSIRKVFLLFVGMTAMHSVHKWQQSFNAL